MGKTQKLKFPHFTWTNIENVTEATMHEMGRTHRFHPLDIADCLSQSHRSKIDTYDSYIFLSLLFPIYDYQTRQIESAEIDIFIGKDYLITLHNGNLGVFNEYFNLFQLSKALRDKYTDRSPERLLYEILHKLYVYCLPMIDHLSDDCDKIERMIFAGKEKKLISEILFIRRNITDYRKIMQVHKNVMKKLIFNLKENQIYVINKTDAYFESLLNYAKEIWDTLENLKERIEALQQTNESQLSFKLSDIMKTLTVLTVAALPINMIAGIFGMNAEHIPFISHQYDFWIIISIMLSLVIVAVLLFKRKGWM